MEKKKKKEANPENPKWALALFSISSKPLIIQQIMCS